MLRGDKGGVIFIRLVRFSSKEKAPPLKRKLLRFNAHDLIERYMHLLGLKCEEDETCCRISATRKCSLGFKIKMLCLDMYSLRRGALFHALRRDARRDARRDFSHG